MNIFVAACALEVFKLATKLVMKNCQLICQGRNDRFFEDITVIVSKSQCNNLCPLSSCCQPLNNYMVFNDSDGLYTYTFEAEKKVIYPTY